MRQYLLTFLFLSLLLSFPSITRIQRVLPLLQAEVRAAAPRALETLRARGLWLVNVDLQKITKDDRAICFFWEHRYTRRTGRDPTETLTTCISS